MAEYLIQDTTLTGIADAIRGKTGSADPITVSDMAAQIAGITTGGGSVEGVHFVTFMSEDGTAELYKRPVADGDNCADPVARGLMDAPTKESTVQYDYTYAGWSASAGGSADASVLNAVTGDKIVYAAYTSDVRYYTVRFYDGETMLHSVVAEYGSTPVYTPEKSGYEFLGWNPEIASVTGDADYYAMWKTSAQLAAFTWPEIAALAESGEAAEIFKLGDTKTVDMTVNGTVYLTEMQIVGFGHDDLADGSGKAGISFLCHTLPNITKAMSASTKTHNGYTTVTAGGWGLSDMRTYLNETVFAGLPTELQNAIKEVTKKSDYGTSSIVYDVVDKCWIPCCAEVGNESAGQKLNLGNPYELYAGTDDTNDSPIKYVHGTTTAQSWWLRDSNGTTNNAFAGYYQASKSGGNSGYNKAINASYFAFGFCI